MTWQSAHDLIQTRSCSVQGCTGLVYSKDGGLCKWHETNGTPDSIRSKRTNPTDEQKAVLQDRVDELDRQIGRLMEERRRVYRRLSRMSGDPT